MPNLTEPLTASHAGGIIISDFANIQGGPALVAQSAATAEAVTSLDTRTDSLESTATTLDSRTDSLETAATSLDERVTAVEANGGSEPDVRRGPFQAGVLTGMTKITEFTATDLGIPAGSQATIGIRVQGSTAGGNQLTRSLSFALSNVAGVLSTPSFDAATDITSGSLQEAESGWSSLVQIATGGTSIEVFGLAGTATSVWRAAAWVSSLAPLAADAAVAQEVTLTAPSATSVDVPVRWMATTGITGVYCNQTGTLPGTPAWVTPLPATVNVAGGGAQTIYYWGQYATGITARKSVVCQVTLDAVHPTVTAFTMADVSAVLEVAIDTLTASEAVTWHYQIDNATLTNPTWGAAPTSITFATFANHVVYMWCRDLAENVCDTPATQTVLVSQSLYSDTFDAANADWVGYNSPVFSITGGNLHRTDSGAYRQVYNMCDGALPADYVVTWRFMSAELAGGYLGFATQYNDATRAGVQVWWAGSTPASAPPTCGFGTLSDVLTNGTWSGTQALPATWDDAAIVHQLSIASSTVGETTTYSLYLDGVLYGTFVGTTAAAGRGIAWVGTTDAVGQSRNMMDVQVTATVPAYNATP